MVCWNQMDGTSEHNTKKCVSYPVELEALVALTGTLLKPNLKAI